MVTLFLLVFKEPPSYFILIPLYTLTIFKGFALYVGHSILSPSSLGILYNIFYAKTFKEAIFSVITLVNM